MMGFEAKCKKFCRSAAGVNSKTKNTQTPKKNKKRFGGNGKKFLTTRQSSAKGTANHINFPSIRTYPKREKNSHWSFTNQGSYFNFVISEKQQKNHFYKDRSSQICNHLSTRRDLKNHSILAAILALFISVSPFLLDCTCAMEGCAQGLRIPTRLFVLYHIVRI